MHMITFTLTEHKKSIGFTPGFTLFHVWLAGDSVGLGWLLKVDIFVKYTFFACFRFLKNKIPQPLAIQVIQASK